MYECISVCLYLMFMFMCDLCIVHMRESCEWIWMWGMDASAIGECVGGCVWNVCMSMFIVTMSVCVCWAGERACALFNSFCRLHGLRPSALALRQCFSYFKDAHRALQWSSMGGFTQSVTSRPAEHLWLPLGGSGDSHGHLVERDLWDCPVLTGSAHG